MSEIWSFRVEVTVPTADLVGFDVEGSDGHIGEIDEASEEVGSAHIVVDTGFWIFGKQRVVPARAIRRIDPEEEKVFVDMTKDEVKNAPDHRRGWTEPDHRSAYDEYYAPFGW